MDHVSGVVKEIGHIGKTARALLSAGTPSQFKELALKQLEKLGHAVTKFKLACSRRQDEKSAARHLADGLELFYKGAVPVRVLLVNATMTFMLHRHTFRVTPALFIDTLVELGGTPFDLEHYTDDYDCQIMFSRYYIYMFVDKFVDMFPLCFGRLDIEQPMPPRYRFLEDMCANLSVRFSEFAAANPDRVTPSNSAYHPTSLVSVFRSPVRLGRLWRCLPATRDLLLLRMQSCIAGPLREIALGASFEHTPKSLNSVFLPEHDGTAGADESYVIIGEFPMLRDYPWPHALFKGLVDKWGHTPRVATTKDGRLKSPYKWRPLNSFLVSEEGVTASLLGAREFHRCVVAMCTLQASDEGFLHVLPRELLYIVFDALASLILN